MKVSELIEALKGMPSEAEVWHVWDGAARTEIECVWLDRSGKICTSDDGEVVYSDEDRPINAPSEKDFKYWSAKSKEARGE